MVLVTGSQFLCVYSSTHWFPQYLCVVPMIGSQFLFVYTWFQSLVPIVSLCGSNDGFAVFVCVWFEHFYHRYQSELCTGVVSS